MELPLNDKLVDERDALYSYDAAGQKDVNDKKPWKKDPHHFTTVRVSAVALVKMVMHARSGGEIEVMGLMQGYVDGAALVVTDAFRLPVEGTETRVNAQEDANEYMVEYLRLCREEAGPGARAENVVGWYHSHPGYGCWLSGIDVSTQANMQQFQDPFVAVVIDPDRTVSAGKVEIGAFRTYPENYKPSGSNDGSSSTQAGPDGYQSVPLNKAEDFGAHSSRYYSLGVEHFKSTLDSRLLELLWNKYWVQTLAQNPLLTNRDFNGKRLADLAYRVQEAGKAVDSNFRLSNMASSKAMGGMIDKVVRDTKDVAAKQKAGLAATEVKVKIFSSGG